MPGSRTRNTLPRLASEFSESWYPMSDVSLENDGQAQTQAVFGALVLGNAEELLKDGLLVLARNAHAGVPDLEDQHVVPR